MKTKEADSKFIAETYARFPLEITGGHGSVVIDEKGKEYIDLGSGIAVNTFGIADEKWINAVTGQLSLFQHTSNLYYSSPCTKLAEMLCARTEMEKVFFSNSGAESNECAIKAARKYAEQKEKSTTIITLKNSFHGRTITTLAATGQDVFHTDFLPLTGGFLYAEANNIQNIKAMAEKYNPAAIMIEIVQGEGGVNALERSFVKGIEALCHEHDILLICDEVQIGNGRSGMLYGYMNYHIKPDIITTAKGLGGGLPIGATILGEKVKDIFKPGSHGSTFGGNPVACAGAVNILERIDEKLMASVRKKTNYIIHELTGAKGIKSVSGMGFMLGIETEKDASVVINKCLEKGVLVLIAKNKVRLLPALNIPDELLQRAIEIIKIACAE